MRRSSHTQLIEHVAVILERIDLESPHGLFGFTEPNISRLLASALREAGVEAECEVRYPRSRRRVDLLIHGKLAFETKKAVGISPTGRPLYAQAMRVFSPLDINRGSIHDCRKLHQLSDPGWTKGILMVAFDHPDAPATDLMGGFTQMAELAGIKLQLVRVVPFKLKDPSFTGGYVAAWTVKSVRRPWRALRPARRRSPLTTA